MYCHLYLILHAAKTQTYIMASRGIAMLALALLTIQLTTHGKYVFNLCNPKMSSVMIIFLQVCESA